MIYLRSLAAFLRDVLHPRPRPLEPVPWNDDLTAVARATGVLREDTETWDPAADQPVNVRLTDPDPRPGGLAAHISRTDTPLAEAAVLAVYGEALADWAREVEFCADDELQELIRDGK